MPSLENVLASIPGYGGYIAKKQVNEQAGMQEVQQASALVGLQQHLQERAKEEAFRTDLQNLGPNATQDQLAQVAAKYSKPGEVLKTQQSSLDRQASVEAARVNAQATREQRAADLQARLADQRLNTQDRLAVMKEIAQLRTQAAQERPPSGYRKSAEGNLEPIPGGPADTKITGAFNADTANLESSTAGLNRMQVAANELLNHPGLPGITGLRGAFPNIPGTPAADAQAKLESLKSQVGFSVLQAMRDASKTGGALGNVSDAEGKRLEANLAALQNAQSEDQFRSELKKILTFTDEAKGRLRTAYNLKHKDRVGGGEPVPPAPVPPPPAAGAVPEFATEADAAAANLAPGTKVKIGGKSGTWR